MTKLIVTTLLCLLLQKTDAQCNAALRPVIFVHGFLASGDTWSNAIHFFKQSGYCSEQLYVFDWNSVSGNGRATEQALEALIDSVRRKTGAPRVDLVGHSAGGGLARSLLKDSVQAQKVGRYIHIGSRKWTTSFSWFTNEKCMNIFSSGDRVAGNGAGPVEGASNIALTEEDHYQVATSNKALASMLDFLSPKAESEGIDRGNAGSHTIKSNNTRANNTKPANVKAVKTKKTAMVEIAGRAVLLGDNMPMREASISIYRIDKKTGARETTVDPIRLSTVSSGHWGPAMVRSGQPYEIELVPAKPATKKISYFFTSFTYDDPLVYLRGFPEGTRMSALLGKIPESEEQSALVLYSAAAAMIGGRDSVTVNDFTICSFELTPASRTVITSFIFDDGDGISSGKVLKQYSSAPFIGGVDRLLPAGEGQVHRIYFNGQRLAIPGVPSSDRILLAVLK